MAEHDDADGAALRDRLDSVAAILDLTPDALAQDHRAGPIAAMMRQMQADGARREDPSREVFARLGDKWSTLLLLLLKTGPFRHGVLLRLVGVVGMDQSISQRMLTLRLRSLQRDGLVVRTVVSERPLHIEYGLTPAGCELNELIVALLDWIRLNAPATHAARVAFERSQEMW